MNETDLASEDGRTRVRQAVEHDAPQIREIYLATYGEDYAYPEFYDINRLKKATFADDQILMVAEDVESGTILGTASVILEVGAYADLVGEFGRLAVHPDARKRGIGRLLMQGRLECVQNRLHVGLVDNRVAHPYSQKISSAFDFVPVGYVPKKLMLARRESVSVFARYFGNALALRRNHPRIIPEADALADIALANCGLPCGAIVDDTSPPYPRHEDFESDSLTTERYAMLIRFERGRVGHREIFGPMRLHYGLFKIKASQSNYILAREGGRVVGAIGFTVDVVEKAVRVLEIVSASEQPIRFLLNHLVAKCRDELQIEYIEVDVSAFAPRMQRTLLELDFLPVAYIPALAFHDVERLDGIKMVRLLVPFEAESPVMIDEMKPIADVVVESFTQSAILPRIAEAAPGISLFADLTNEQVKRVASSCRIEHFEAGDTIFAENQRDGKTHIVLFGQIEIKLRGNDKPVGQIGAGECVGEMSLLCSAPHSATAIATSPTETAVISQDALHRLVRQRPGIGVVLYRNLAVGLGEKLWRLDQRMAANS